LLSVNGDDGLSRLEAPLTDLRDRLAELERGWSGSLEVLRAIFALNKELGRFAREERNRAYLTSITELQLRINALTIVVKRGRAAAKEVRTAFADVESEFLRLVKEVR
jgi:hypothetical protein